MIWNPSESTGGLSFEPHPPVPFLKVPDVARVLTRHFQVFRFWQFRCSDYVRFLSGFYWRVNLGLDSNRISAIYLVILHLGNAA